MLGIKVLHNLHVQPTGSQSRILVLNSVRDLSCFILSETRLQILGYCFSSFKNCMNICEFKGVAISQILWYFPRWKNRFYWRWRKIIISFVHFHSKPL